MELITVSKIAGAELAYSRPPVAPVDTEGDARSFRVDQQFARKLTKCFEELWDICPWGRAERIVTAGLYVEKAGMHGSGRAMDIDAIFWPDNHWEAETFHLTPKVHLGIEAVLRRHFGNVLGYLYNQAHTDHFHVDDGAHVGFHTKARSVGLFVQAAMAEVQEINVEVDGVIGPMTRAAMGDSMLMLSMANADPETLIVQDVWLDWLKRIANEAFS